MLFSNLMDFKFNQLSLQRNQIIIAAAVVLGLLILGVGGYFYYQSQKGQNLTNVQQGSPEEVNMLVEQVGKLMDLPTGEVPQVATVTDVTQLQNQPFFARAKNGDKVLIYQVSGKAILYDPVAKKIIDVTIVNLGPQPTPTGGEATPSASPVATPAQ